MFRPRALVLFVTALALAGAAPQGQAGGQQGSAAPPVEAAAAGQEPASPDDSQATFRTGINFVRVDVIVTGRNDEPVTDLTIDDFEIVEDGQQQEIEQFRLIRVDGNPGPDDPLPREIRTRADEELEANREDVRVFAFLLDDYHVRRINSMAIREPLTRFINTYLGPNDLVTVMYPLTPVSSLTFTRNHEEIISAINNFEGRKYDYRPRNVFEEQYSRYPTETVERIRNDVVMGALKGLSVRLGSLREGRKSIVFVSEGLTAMLPPQMQSADASRPLDPFTATARAGAQDSSRQQTAEFFNQSELYMRMREVFQDANRNNASIYALDPRGLTPFEFAIDDLPGGAMPSFATDQRVLQMSQDTLRTLAEETDGRAIVNRNSLVEGLAQIVRDSSFYYLLGYNSTEAQNDGKFHEIDVRVKRRGVEVRARKGYWALTPDDAIKAENPTPDLDKPVAQALASIAAPVQAARYVRTWVGTERGDNGKTRVTLVWEPLSGPPGARRETAGRVAVLAANAAGDLVYRGRTPNDPLAPAAAGAVTPPQQLTFDTAPGTLELRLTVEGEGGGTLDSEIRTIEVPDLTAPEAAISTPRVFRARTAREMQTYAADPNAVPVAMREFSRTERLLIRFNAYGAGTATPEPTAALLNRQGDKMSDLPVAAAPHGGTHQVNVPLASVPAGEYLVEIAVPGGGAASRQLVAFRVTS